jgi:hypothetical protein
MMDVICCKPVDTRDDGDSDAGGSSTNDHGGKILECDYDTKCTKLYKLIESKNWEEIIYFLETGKWYFDTTIFTSMFFGSGPDPRFIESRTWVTALDEMGSVRWCQLPLHAAITFQAPFEVIKKLVEVYPESVRCADDQDMLPLHYAFRFGSEDKILAYILEDFPQALRKKALRDRMPLDMAHYSSKPERGVIIECYVEASIAEAKVDWDAEMNAHVRSTSSNVEYELMEAKSNLKELEEKLRDLRTPAPTSRYSISWNGSLRGGKDKRDEESLDPTMESVIDKKHKGFGKIFGRQKKQSVS